jgi:hypothetical protein
VADDRPLTRAAGRSDLCLLCDLERVVDLDAEIADRAIELGVPEQQLYRRRFLVRR